MESSLITAGLIGSIITIIIQTLLNNWFEEVKNRREIRKLVFQRKTEIVEKAMLCYQNAIDAYLTLQTGLKGSNKDFVNPIAVGNIQAAIDRLNKLSYDNENRIYLYYDFRYSKQISWKRIYGYYKQVIPFGRRNQSKNSSNRAI